MNKLCFPGAAAVLLLIGCTGEEPVETLSSGVDTLTLSVVDTLGVLMGDSTQMFGSIGGVAVDDRGNLLILDGLKARISVFSPELDYLCSFGGKGSGPGEFQYPRYFTLEQDGSIAVSDWGVNTISLFDENYVHTATVEGFYPTAPAFITPACETGYIGGGMSLTPADNEIGYEGTTFIGLWTDGAEPSVIYEEFPLDISVEANGENVSVNVDHVDAVFDTDLSGNLYVAVRSDSTYAIRRYTREGEQDLCIEREWTRIAKTEEELQEEILLESHSRHGDGSTSARQTLAEDTYPWHNAISLLRTDDERNLWVGQGYTSMPVFHVYDPAGELIRVVVIPDLEGVSGLDYSFRNGLLAFHYAPDDYPKVFILQEPAD